MRSAIKAALSLSVGSTALILSGVAFGQGNTGVGGINFGDFGLTATCNSTSGPAGADPGTCKVIASGAGFVQRQFAVGGKTFIQTVQDDNGLPNSSGFKSEDYVRLNIGASGAPAGTNVPGISSKLDIAPLVPTTGAGAGEVFKTSSMIKSGWAVSDTNCATAGGACVTDADITLNLAKTGTTGNADDFKSDFAVVTRFDKQNPNINVISKLRVDQTVNLGSASEKQVFATQIATAPADGTLAFGSVPGSKGGFGTVAWTGGQMLQATYVGQAIGIGGDPAAPALANFASETVSNVSAPASGATTWSNLNQAAPTYWVTASPAGAVMDLFAPPPVFLP